MSLSYIATLIRKLIWALLCFFFLVETFIDANRLPHLLFYGPPGTGKTSTILACARKLYGDNYKSMILEVNNENSTREGCTYIYKHKILTIHVYINKY